MVRNIPLPAGLEQKVMARLALAQNRQIKTRLIGLTGLTTVSLTSLVVVLVFVTRSFVASGFYQYLQLVFSDISVLTSVGKDLALSLAESLPILGTILTLALLIIFIWSVTNLITQSYGRQKFV